MGKHEKNTKFFFKKRNKNLGKNINKKKFKQKKIWRFRKFKKILILKKKEIRVLYIKLKRNNIFTVLTHLNRAVVKKFFSSEMLKIKFTKRQLFFNISNFFKKILKFFKKDLKNRIIIMLKMTKRLRKKVIKWWVGKKRKLKSQFSIVFLQSKAFNGCRLRKMKRRKRIRYRYFKNII